MLLSHWASTGDSLQDLSAQRKMLGIDDKMCAKNRFKAVDVLGDSYVALEVQITRSASGMGIVMDAACNMVKELDRGGPGMMAGLRKGDCVVVVDGVAVTAIENGYIVPRSLVTSAIDPARQVIHLTVFRKFVEGDVL